jgi:DNA-directed RNA polymerase specialized sigma24 family protein
LISKYNIFKNRGTKDKNLLMLELAEVKDIADIIFKRLNRKIEVLESIESSVDEKIKMLEDLIKKAESLKVSSLSTDKHTEIVSLGRKGMDSREIADILDIPVGEVELLLSLKGIGTPNHN